MICRSGKTTDDEQVDEEGNGMADNVKRRQCTLTSDIERLTSDIKM